MNTEDENDRDSRDGWTFLATYASTVALRGKRLPGGKARLAIDLFLTRDDMKKGAKFLRLAGFGAPAFDLAAARVSPHLTLVELLCWTSTDLQEQGASDTWRIALEVFIRHAATSIDCLSDLPEPEPEPEPAATQDAAPPLRPAAGYGFAQSPDVGWNATADMIVGARATRPASPVPDDD